MIYTSHQSDTDHKQVLKGHTPHTLMKEVN